MMSVLAMMMQPDVSLSRRWTMPGLSAPPSGASLPLQWCRRALTRVPVWFPAAGWTTIPEFLLMTMRWSSSWRTSSGMSSGWACCEMGSGMWMVMMSPESAAFLGLAVAPFTRILPDFNRVWIRARVRSGSSAHRYLSSLGFVVSCTVIFMVELW